MGQWMKPFDRALLILTAGLILIFAAAALFNVPDALATRDQVDHQRMFMVSTSTTMTASATSAEIDLEDYCLVGLQYATMAGTTLTATCSNVAGGTFVALNGSDNLAWSITIGDDRFVDLTQGGEAICGCRFMKLVSGSSETVTIQLVLGR